MEFGKPELIERKVIQSGIGTMKDHIEDFVFKNNCPLYEDLIKEIEKLTGYKTVPKEMAEWLECTTELISTTKDEITIRFTIPYCD